MTGGTGRTRRGTAGPYLWLTGLAAAPPLALGALALFGDHTAPRMPGFAPAFSQSDVATALFLVMLVVMVVSVAAGAVLIRLLRRTRYGGWPVYVQGGIPVILQFLIGVLLFVFAVLG